MSSAVLFSVVGLHALSALGQGAEPGGAAQCEVDPLRSASPEVRRHFSEVRDQGRSNWCHSYVAADLLTQRLGRSVSAAHLAAAGYAEDLRDRRARQGQGATVWDDRDWLTRNNNITQVIAAAQRGPICTEEGLPSRDPEKRVQQVEDHLLAVRRQAPGGSARLPNPFCETSRRHGLLPGLSDELMQTVASQVGPDRPSVASRLAAEACQRSQQTIDISGVRAQILDGPKQGEPSSAQTQQFLGRLDEQLTRGQVVGVAFTPEWLNRRGAPSEGGHYATVVGRIWDQRSRQCLYVFRNTWGRNGCGDLIRPATGVVCNPNGRSGTFAVSRARLRDAISGVAYLER